MRATLKAWKNCDLSIIGKVTIVNSLVASLFVHKMMVLPSITEKNLTLIEGEISKFIWNGAKAKISIKKLQRNKRQGGLQLVCLRRREIALKATWIQLLRSDDKCAEIAYAVFSPVIKEVIFKCAFNQDDVIHICPVDVSHFWNSVLTAWSTVNYRKQCKFSDQVIWWNSRIRVQNKPIMWETCYQNGLVWISDLYSDGSLITAERATRKFHLTVMQYNALISAIPIEWKRALANADVPRKCYYDEIVSRKNLSRHIYAELTVADDLRMDDVVIERWGK